MEIYDLKFLNTLKTDKYVNLVAIGLRRREYGK